MSERLLSGNGAALLRERAMASRVQRALERLYQLDPLDDVDAFIAPAEDGERETLFVRELEGVVELRLRLPSCFAEDDGAGAMDGVCQIIEGVSHFVYVADRARAERSATQLELELQAEVDKWVVLAASLGAHDARRGEALRARLYEDVRFAHDEGTERGHRYRVASATAHRFVRALDRRFLARGKFAGAHAALRGFFRANLEEKLRLARAA